MICWNVRGLNKSARCLEVGVHLKNLQVSCLALLETRVKANKSDSVRKRLGFNWDFIDNYECHINGRIWIAWDPNIWSIIPSEKTDQLIHSTVYNRAGDFNNILKVGDRIGGNEVHLAEYIDMEEMMVTSSLAEHESIGPWFTWHNKQLANPIYSRIDRGLVNAEWHRTYPNSSVEVLNPSISDHALLRIKLDSLQTVKKIKHRFKFLNCIAGHANFLQTLRANWTHIGGDNPMAQFWKNLHKLQYSMKGLTWQMTEGIRNLNMSRENLDKAQTRLAADQMNPTLCQEVKFWTDEVLKNSELEEQILQQKLKCDWINLGDGNNAYFYANLKSKNKQVQIKELEDANGNKITEQEDIETEVLSFYTNLVGQAARQRSQVDICSLRGGAQLSREQMDCLIGPVTEAEIWKAIHSMGDSKAPGVDGLKVMS
ncbi:uncharacterized protein LOC131651279 [Vicia villosa]|uniref:uncharacterized protein LOC131651279 n=1 Tax=Vicia villosa TaxID=3911 RepID=UPI00273B6D99|nr:uncharacterized protein LOC131651279 [Vicia villosa]